MWVGRSEQEGSCDMNGEEQGKPLGINSWMREVTLFSNLEPHSRTELFRRRSELLQAWTLERGGQRSREKTLPPNTRSGSG